MTFAHPKQDFWCSAKDGLRLHALKFGWNNPAKSTVICLPGFIRTCNDFDRLGAFLASGQGGNWRVLAIDARGRGQSDYDTNWNNYTLATEAEDVLSILTAAGCEGLHLIGTSRGGLIAMLLGGMRPGVLKSVIFNDIGPVIDGRGLVRLKRALEENTAPKNLEEAVKNLQRLGSIYFPDLPSSEWEIEANRSYKNENSKLVPTYDLKLLNGLKGLNLDVRLANMWQEFAGLTNIPALLIRGENSDFLSLETVQQMQLLHPKMEFLSIAGQGHAPKLGYGELPGKIAAFLSDT